ncbi:hypothetical protein [Salinibius halmophilus]|uniref:hypothetical protein n=1 Tax=Salinibius halmophilus TaxID=1853216 RepID=UPI000E664E7B|nr:hypothetical protein [Salinibius halmophilus]
MKKVILLVALISGSAMAAPNTLMGGGDGYWGWLISPELRVLPNGLGVGGKLALARYEGDHGLLIGGQFNLHQLGDPGTDISMTQYGLMLGYRYMPYQVAHWDTEVVLGQISQNDGNGAATAFAGELSGTWKVNVHPNIQVGVGLAAIVSGQPDSDTIAAVETLAGRLVFEFGKF